MKINFIAKSVAQYKILQVKMKRTTTAQ